MSQIRWDGDNSVLSGAQFIIPTEFDLDLLVKEAIDCADQESLFIIGKGVDFRIGVGVEILVSGAASFSIELLLRIFHIRNKVNPGALNRIAKIQEDLTGNGHSFFHEEGGWLVLEKPIQRNIVEIEISSLLNYLTSNKVLVEIGIEGDAK